MQTTEPQTVSESVEEPLPPQSTDKTGSSPASQVVQDTTTPATMGSSKPPQSESDVHAKMRGELEGQQPQDAISTLHSLFPSLDKETIQDIYRAQGQDADRTASLLIQLSGDAPEIDSVLHGEHQVYTVQSR